MRGQLAYDWPPAAPEIEERDGWKNNLAWIFCVWWKTPQLRRRARWDSGTGTMPTDAPVADNLKAIAKRLDRDVEDLVVIVLDRPRHEKIIEEIRTAGARIRLIGDGDLSAGISAAVVGTGVHAVMGTGGAPEGVLTAAALRCLNGQIFARLG